MDASLKALIALRTRSRSRSEPFSFPEVLEHELAEVRLARAVRGVDPGADDERPVDSRLGSQPLDAVEEERQLFAHALRHDLVGLAFSGGGIRSATFNLGVLQGLADLQLLNRFDYLSTVSGGGYIGSWFTALLHRERLAAEKEAAERARGAKPQKESKTLVGRALEQVSGVFKAFTKADLEAADAPPTPPPPVDGAVTIERVAGRLRTRPRLRGGGREGRGRTGPEDPAITFLRRFSNYLTPKVGLLTADTWAVITTYLRNLLLNLALLVSGLSLILLVPRLLLLGSRQLGRLGVEPNVGIAFVLASLAVVFIGYNMAFFDPAIQRESRWRGQGAVQVLIVAPLLLAAAVMATLGASAEEDAPSLYWVEWATVCGVGFLGAWCFSGVVARVRFPEHRGGIGWSRLILWALPAGAVGGLIAVSIFARMSAASDWHNLAWGPPLVLLCFTLVGVVHIGFMGGGFGDDQREWLGRLGAWLLIYALVWATLWSAVLFGPVLIAWAKGWFRWLAAGSWLALTAIGVLAARSRLGGAVVRSAAARVAPYVFILGLIALLAYAVDWALAALPRGAPGEVWSDFGAVAPKPWGLRLFMTAVTEEGGRLATLVAQHSHVLAAERPREILLLGGLLLLTVLFLSRRIDINEFSMHRFYRNRLVRCFLGASVDPELRRRRRQPFTGFHADDFDLADLGPDDLGPPQQVHSGPLPIVNAALNLVGGGDLAWQERKAASFVFTPLYSGFDVSESADGVCCGGYRRTSSYASDPNPLTLGGAIAISGAAANPNMGYRSTPALALLLTVFNLRLGWWLGNPADDDTWRYSGPRFSALHLLREVLGLTDASSGYVNLSDGGHFENLGIYELVRRRCRFIIASDAAGDPELAFQDLGNAIRKCRTDLGVEIEIRPDFVRRPDGERHSRWHCAVGRIRYDRLNPHQGEGTLIYLKSSLTGDEPEDVLNYAAEHPEFPHETTADQWFTESQFESYRALGHHVAVTALGRGVEAARSEQSGNDERLNVERLFVALRQQWHPPSRVGAQAFTRNAETLERLFHKARAEERLQFLDPQFYPEWESLMAGEPRAVQQLPLPPGATERRQGFYFCNSLIQLMENVYHDLRLETDYDHPDNRGWMNLFKHWSWAGMFRATWAVSSATCGSRFQRFCEQRLGLTVGKVYARTMPLEGFAEAQELNFFEKRLIAAFLAHQRRLIERGGEGTDPALEPVTAIERLEVSVGATGDEGRKDALLRFTCGFALVSGAAGAVADPVRIQLFRIQDHLRKMGLGRMSLRSLAKKRVLALALDSPDLPRDDDNQLAADFAEFDRRAWKRFRRLHASVLREVGESRRLQAERS